MTNKRDVITDPDIGRPFWNARLWAVFFVIVMLLLITLPW
jgi:hypothetical protein